VALRLPSVALGAVRGGDGSRCSVERTGWATTARESTGLLRHVPSLEPCAADASRPLPVVGRLPARASVGQGKTSEDEQMREKMERVLRSAAGPAAVRDRSRERNGLRTCGSPS